MRAKDAPLISVVIPTYSRPKNLPNAIESVLNQTYKNIEVIIVDDNDPSSSARQETERLIKRRFDLQCINYIKHSKNKNGAAARNTGIRQAKGDFISFLDDDDTYSPNRISELLCLLNKSPRKVTLALSAVRIVRPDMPNYTIKVPSGTFHKELLACEYNFGTGSNIFVRKDTAEELNGFDESFERHQDWEFLVRLFRKYSAVSSPSTLVTKYDDSPINNYPNPDKLIQIKEKYLEKFSNDIERYSQKERALIYGKHQLEISLELIKSRRIVRGLWQLAQAYKKGARTHLKCILGAFKRSLTMSHDRQ